MTPASGSLRGKTIVMSGGSRGIGRAIAVRAAQDGANVVMLAKTAVPTAKLRGTIFDAAEEIEAAGGRALAVVGDVRSDESIADAVDAAVSAFGGIDVCINNASALHPYGTLDLMPSQYDLMHDVNTRGTFMLTRACMPYLLLSPQAHVLTLSPPLNLASSYWLARFPGYLMSKYGMSLATLAFAAEFHDRHIAVNSLWPRTTIATDAVSNLLGGAEAVQRSRWPAIMADAAHAVISAPVEARSGQLLIDEDVLRDHGVTDFGHYAVGGATAELEPDFFLQ